MFDVAVSSRGDDALALWRGCLEAGDQMAHFALGYTLYEMGRYHDAYRHLRYYAEIAPAASWNWCWLGMAAERIGELAEARHAYERALALERSGAGETEAGKLLGELERRDGARHDTADS